VSDFNGSIYISGLFSGNVDFNSGPDINSCRCKYENVKSFILKYDSIGDYQWSNCYINNLENIHIDSIACDNNGNFYCVGEITNANNIDPNLDGTNNIQSEVLIQKFNTNGNLMANRNLFNMPLDSSTCTANKIIVSDSEDIYIVGNFEGQLSFEQNGIENVHISNGDRDSFLCKLNPELDMLWLRTWGSEFDNDNANDIDIDANNNLFVTGIYNRFKGITFDNGNIYNADNIESLLGCYLAKFTNGGSVEWINTYGGDYQDSEFVGSKVLCSGNNEIFVLGEFESSISIEIKGINESFHATGSRDVILLALSSDGNTEWVRTWGGIGMDQAYSLFTDNYGNLFCGIGYIGEIDMDPNIRELLVDSNGQKNSLLCVLDQNGEFQWSHNWNCRGINGISFNNDIYITGYFNSTMDVGNLVNINIREAVGITDGFVLCFKNPILHE
jgi:hypothetical protein